MTESETSHTDESDLARRFLAALAEAAKTGDPEPLYPLLADDVDWAPRALSGIDDVREHSNWAAPPENLHYEFEVGEIQAVGGGEIVVEVRQLYRMKASGELVSTRDRRIELTVRDGRISRYDMQVIG